MKEEAMKGTRRPILAAAVIVLVVGGAAAAIFLVDYFGAVKSNIRKLGNPDERVQKQAVDALVQMGQSAVPALAEALKDKNSVVRTNAPKPPLTPPPVLSLHDKNSVVRMNAAKALGQIGPKAQAAVPALVEALKDKRADVGAAEALAMIGSKAEAAAPALVKALKDEEQNVRRNAAKGAGEDR